MAHIRPNTSRLALNALGATAAALALTAGTAAPAGAAGAPDRPRAERYVALGDSFTAGPLVPRQVSLLCARSDANYPSLTARSLGVAAFRDVSCINAKTDHMWRYQAATGNPAQLNALGTDTTLVSLGVGGNDINFTEILLKCTFPFSPIPEGSPCQQKFTNADGTDELAKRTDETAPKVGAVLHEIHARAPHARVVVVGYPALLSEDGQGCRESLKIADGDIPYLRGTVRRLNAMLRREAVAAGATYVNTYATTVGHDACQAPEDRWIEGMNPVEPGRAASFHPNADGERAMAEAVTDTLLDGPEAKQR